MDDEKAYLEARLKENGFGLEPLTKGQKEDLTRESDNYHKQKKEFIDEISNNERKIKGLQKRIQDLNIPSIPGAKYLHDQNNYGMPCGLRTAIFYGSIAAMTNAEYYCLFCKTNFYSEQ